MKRVVQLFVVCMTLMASVSMGHAQSFFEDFETGIMDSSFVLINGDSLIPADVDDAAWADTAWIVTSSSVFTGFAALSISWYADAGGNDVGPCNDWLILPKMIIDTGAVLRFDAKSATSSGSFPDDYWVLLNPGSPTIESFADSGTILLQIDDEESANFMSHEVDLADYAGQEVYIAFRNVTNIDGYGLWIDNIFVGKSTSTAIDADNAHFNLQLFPNPSQNESRLSFSLESAGEVEIQVKDLTGRTALTLQKAYAPQGNQEVLLPASQLAKGVYVVTIRNGNKVGALRWVITE